MLVSYARRLTGKLRTQNANRELGQVLAFIAGATNAGAFLAVQQYTSHMTGMLSSLADSVVLGEYALAANAVGALVSFLAGAATSAVMVNFAKRRFMHSQYALPLLLEAALLLLFGFIGAKLDAIPGLFVPATVILLCFNMGLQNALITKISKSEIRTTHVTGLITDLGIELGKLLYWNRIQRDPELFVSADRNRLLVLVLLVSWFFIGGVLGAIGFHRLGYITTLPLALLLVLLAAVPAMDDVKDFLNQLRSPSTK